MARIYSNENVPLPVVEHLRALGHDVLTSSDAGNANRRVPDEAVVQFAFAQRRMVLTNNRRDFLRLHRNGVLHCGLIVFTTDVDFKGLAGRIASALAEASDLGRPLINVLKTSFEISIG